MISRSFAKAAATGLLVAGAVVIATATMGAAPAAAAQSHAVQPADGTTPTTSPTPGDVTWGG